MSLFGTQHLQPLAGRFRYWPSLLLGILLVFGWKSALAQSSAGSLRCGAPSGSGTTSRTPTTTKKNSKVDQFNAVQQQEVKNQQAIQNAGDDILNGLKGSGKSDLKPDDSADDDSDDPASRVPMEASPSEATSGTSGLSGAAPPSSNSAAAVNSLLDDPSEAATTSNSAAAVNSLLDDNNNAAATPNSAAAVNSLLEDQTATTAATPTVQSAVPNPAFAAMIPQNPSFATAMQSSADTAPTSAVLQTVQQEADVANPSSSIADKLQDLFSTVTSDMASVKATLVTLMDTPTAQILDGCVCTTAPAIVATDTPEQMAAKVHDQAIVGFGYFTQSAFPKALYNYMSSNINQFMRQLGFAAPQPDSGNQQ
jgi:hypothetical protein